MTKFKSLILTLSLVLSGISTTWAYTYKNPTGKEFPILAWYSILPDSAQTVERYQELRDAGFNISFPHFGSASQVEKALPICAQTGIKLLVTCGELTTNTAATVNAYKGHEGLGGWFIGDEPGMSQFASYGALAKAIRDNDDEHFIYGNLLPIFATNAQLGIGDGQTYLDYVRGYATDVNTGLLSYDMYPIRTSGNTVKIVDTYYENVETVRKVSEETGQPFWGFCLATAHNTYPVPTLQQLRFQAFVNLLHGAQCIQYFTYWTPGTEVWNFHNAPIDENGQRTDVYTLVQQMNAEIQNQCWVFLGAKVESVGYLSGLNIPDGCSAMKTFPSKIKSVAMTSGNGLLLSHLSNGTKHFFIVMNHQLVSKSVRIRTTEALKKVLKTGEVTDAPTAQTITLQGADYVIYYWDENPTGLKEISQEMSFGASAENGSIHIHGGKMAEIYNLHGQLVGRTQSSMPVQPGMYIVKCGQRSIKIKL